MIEKALVLIIDDSADNSKHLAECVGQFHHIKMARSSEQCLQIAKIAPQPDLILIDLELSGMSGYKVCKELKNNPKTAHIPVIFVNAFQDEENEALGLALGAVDYISKPLRAALVIARVNTHLTLKRQQDKLKQMAFTDQLTGLYNKHMLIDFAGKKMARAYRHKYSLWLLLIDIDHFKEINDTHGHATGNQILKQVAGLLVEDSRSEDIVARLEGDDFVLMFDPCGDIDAHNRAKRILQKIEKDIAYGITISIGMAKMLDKDIDCSRLLARADDALLRAKEKGRNRIEFAVSYQMD